jgi:thiol-disulfide isomerase/thioredoxin
MFLSKKLNPWAVLFFSLLLHLHFNFAYSQTNASQDASKIETLQIEGKTLGNKDFQLSSLKGKVSLVMFWSTSCPVCREQMPELRENIKGWENKPFELVLVSVDKNMKDVEEYYRLLSQVVTSKQRFTQLWSGGVNYKDSISAKQIPIKQLPATFLLDKTGKVVDVFYGRIPALAWDEIAELL